MFKLLRVAFVLLVASCTLTSCGFQPRGLTAISFSSINIQGKTLSISKALRNNLKANGIKVLPTAENADLLLDLTSENVEKRILSLSGAGVVREYVLYYRIHYRLRDANEALWSPEQTIEARRDFTYSDAELLAKQSEEVRLYENMRSDVMSNLMRRLSRHKSAQDTTGATNATGAKP